VQNRSASSLHQIIIPDTESAIKRILDSFCSPLTSHVEMTENKTRMLVVAATPNPVLKSVSAKGDFQHFRSSEQHDDGCA